MREHFEKLARTWIKLADELKQSAEYLAELQDETGPIKRAG
jgi:hypothetical protein